MSVAITLIVAPLLAGASSAGSTNSLARFHPQVSLARYLPPVAATSVEATSLPDAGMPQMPALVDPALDLRAGPVPVPLELHLPSVGVSTEVVAVGITKGNVMDAPTGRSTDPVWQQAFWYRGSAVPGDPSTSLIAAHVNDSLGRPGPFARLEAMRVGDPIVLNDTRTGVPVHFRVTGSERYSLAQAAEPEVLREIYGTGPVEGTAAQPSEDGLSHLSLITCTGTFRNGTHDHRLVVFATRVA